MRASTQDYRCFPFRILLWLCLFTSLLPIARAADLIPTIPHNTDNDHTTTVELGPEDVIALAENRPGDLETAIPVTESLTDVHRKILAETDLLRAQMGARFEALKRTLAEDEIKSAVNKNEIFLEDAVGRAEVYAVNGTHAIRVVHHASELAVFYFPREGAEKSSNHVRQIIARQHIMSGKTRADHGNGRDIIAVWAKNGDKSETEYLPRPTKLSPRWWAEWWQSIYKRPSYGDVVMGTACGLMQTSLALCVAGAKTWLDPRTSMDYSPAAISFLFGTVIGIWNSTYRNFTLNGSKLSQTAKSTSVGALFAYSTMFASGKGYEVLNILGTAGLLANLHVISNLFAKQWAKTEWHQFNRIRNEMRVNAVPLKFGNDIEINQAAIEHQIIYLIPFTLTLADLTGVSVGFPWLGTIPLGKLLLWSSIPFAQYAVLKYAEGQKYTIATELRERWESTKRLPISLFSAAINGMAETFSFTKRSFVSCASWLMGGQKKIPSEETPDE